MTGTLVPRRRTDLSADWRNYWAKVWGKLPGWSEQRMTHLLSATEARKSLKEKKRVSARPPLVKDYPTGIDPFLGVLAVGADGKVAHDAGVLEFPLRGHLLTVAPTRTGKGACHIIPNLLAYAGSALVIDVKGENYAITARRRQEIYPGARVLRFAPLESDSDCYNPLDFIRTDAGYSGPSTYDDARLVSNMLLPTTRREDYWDVEARNLLTVLLMYVAVKYTPGSKDRTMRTVMSLLSPPADPTDLERGHGLTESIRRIVRDAGQENESVLLSIASSFLEHESKVFSNIASTCRAGMAVWYSPNLLKATEKSDFMFSELKSSMCRPDQYDPAPMTLYVVIPPQNLAEYKGVIRMMVGLAIAELTRPPAWATRPGWRAAPPTDVLFLLDELPILGHMGPIVDGLSFLAGYGIRIWSFVQNMGQLKSIYREEWHNFMANAGAMSFFGVNDADTAAYVERLLGETSEYRDYYFTEAESTSDSSTSGFSDNGWSGSDTSGVSSTVTKNVRFVKDPIAKAAEIRALDPDMQLVFIRNTPPILATKMPYFDFPLFRNLVDVWEGH